MKRLTTSEKVKIELSRKKMTQEELDGIVTGVQQAAGHTVRIVDMIPASWQPYVMDREQAKAAGYFGD